MPDNLKAIYRLAGASEFTSLDDGSRLDFDLSREVDEEYFLEWSIKRLLDQARRLGRPPAYRVAYPGAGETLYVAFLDDSYLVVNRGIELGPLTQPISYFLRHYCLFRVQLGGYLEEEFNDERRSLSGANSALIYAGDGIRYGFAIPGTEPVHSVTLAFLPRLLQEFLPLETLQQQGLYHLDSPSSACQLIDLAPTSTVLGLGRQLLALDLAAPAARLVGRGLMLQMLGEVLLQLEQRDLAGDAIARLRQRDIERLLAVRQRIDAAPESPHSLEQLGRWGGLNRRKLTEGFKVLFGITVADYLVSRRMAVARELLQRGESVAVVAEAVGYQDRSSFSRAFRRIHGHSPAALRTTT